MNTHEPTQSLFRELIDKIPAEEKKYFDYTYAVSDRIDELMREQGITQRELARRVGKSPSEVSKWLSGRHNFTLSTIAKISVALNHDMLKVV